MTEPSRIIFLLADGARPDIVEELVHEGKLPNLASLYSPNGEPVRRAVTTMPSATGPAYLPFLTGRLAGPLNIPGIRWFDRFAYLKKQRLRRMRSYVGLGHRYLSTDLDPDLRTLFHYETDHVNVFNPVRHGVAPGRDRLQAARSFYSPAAKYFHGWRLLDRAVARATLSGLESGARLVFATFMGIDENSHDYGARHPKTLEAYRLLDEVVGELRAALERRREADRTRLILSSDHGLSDTHTHFPLAEFVEEHGYRTIYYPRIWRRKARAAVMVSGNALAHVYLQKRGSWAHRSRGNALWAEHGQLLAALAHHPSVDFLAYQHDDGSLVVHRGDDRSRFWHADGKFKFETIGNDPLGLPEGLRILDDEYYFTLSWASDYPDAAHQLLRLFESPRCGDVLVLSRPGHDLRARFEFPKHKASHGSLHRDHMMVPLLINDGTLADAPCRTADAFVYMLHELGHAPRGDLDGRDLPRHQPAPPPARSSAESPPQPPAEAVAPIGVPPS